MKLGEMQLAADGQSLQICGKDDTFTLRIGETYPPKAGQAKSGNGARSALAIRGFVAPSTASEILVIVDYVGSTKKRNTQAITPKNVTANYVVPAESRERARPSQKKTNLSDDLVAQLVADVAELRARVTRLESGK